MARLTEAQIKKLSPEDRKKRAARLAYNKTYDAAKRDGKPTKRRAVSAKSVATSKHDRLTAKAKSMTEVPEGSSTAQLKTAIAEIEALEERRAELIAAMQLILTVKA